MKVLVSIDGSKHSIKAIDYLIKNASMFEGKGSGLIVLHVEPNVIPPEVTQYISKKSIVSYVIRDHVRNWKPIKTHELYESTASDTK